MTVSPTATLHSSDFALSSFTVCAWVRLMERTAVGPCTAAAAAVMLPQTRRLLSATERAVRFAPTR